VQPATRAANADILAATAWELRAAIEARARALTALQRCVEEYRAHPKRDTLEEISRHLALIEDTAEDVGDAVRIARDAVSALESTHA
jgi:hypothetical protein